MVQVPEVFPSVLHCVQTISPRVWFENVDAKNDRTDIEAARHV